MSKGKRRAKSEEVLPAVQDDEEQEGGLKFLLQQKLDPIVEECTTRMKDAAAELGFSIDVKVFVTRAIH